MLRGRWRTASSSSSASGFGHVIDSSRSIRSSYGTPSAFSRATSAALGRVLLGVQDLAGIVEHGLDDADDVDDVGRVVAVERGDHLDGERHQRRREAQRAALVLALDERADAHAEAAAVVRHAAVRRHRPPRGCGTRRSPAAGAGGAAARGRGWCAAGASARPARRGATSTLATRSAVTRNREISGSGRAVDQPLHRRLVVVHEALGRLGLGRLAPRLRVVAGARQRPGVLDHVVGRLHPHVPVGVEAGPPGAPGQLVELADREPPDAACRRTSSAPSSAPCGSGC